MNTYLLPLGATAAAALATYWFCIRPMRRGQHSTSTTAHGCCPPSAPAADLDEQIRQAKHELDQLRREASADNRS